MHVLSIELSHRRPHSNRACMLFFFFLLDENGRPMTALKNDVSFSDLNLAVEEWLTRDFKVTGCNGIIRHSVWFYTTEGLSGIS